MILSKREQSLAIGAAAVVGALLLYFVIISPCLDKWDTVEQGKHDTEQQLKQAKDLFAEQAVLKKVWLDMQKNGLKSDSSQAESQAESSVLSMVDRSGVSLLGLRSERVIPKGKFQVIGFTMTGSGTMQQISQLVWLMESTGIPMQLNDLQITARREGTDDLALRLTFTTLCQIPEGSAPKRTAPGGGESEARS